VQWVVTTGRTVEEARERALDALGVDEADLEVEVLAEPTSRLLGLRRTDARIRARVKPTRPRPKVDRRNRRKPASGGGGGGGGNGGGGNGGGRRRRGRRGDGDGAARTADAEPATVHAPASEPAPSKPAPRGARRPAPADALAAPEGEQDLPRSAPVGPAPASGPADHPHPDIDTAPEGPTGDDMSDITLDEQEPSAVGFVRGLLEAFGVDAEVTATSTDDEHLEIAVTGSDLGLLVGQRGRTLEAVQELTRTAVAQQHSGRLQGRLRVDVAGYRARRKEALERFALQQAERVKETGTKVALEPMSPPDRKIVHDVINDVEGVRTVSEGEDRRRHVVILPD